MKILKKFEIWSAAGTIVIGTLLHFVFNWSGKNHFVAVFSAVNESTWEHLKLAFWPAFIIALIGYFIFGKKNQNFCFAQASKLYLMPILIIGFFYGWLAIFPDNFVADIVNFVLSVVLGHRLAYYFEKSERTWNLKTISQILIVLLLLAFSFFTYFPPHNFLFHDPVDGGYGIPAK